VTDPWQPTGRTVHVLDDRGRIRDWLVGPGWSWPCPSTDLAALLEAEGSPWGEHGRWVLTNGPDVAPLKQRLYERHPLDREQRAPQPIENGPLDWRTHDGQLRTARWRRYRTGTDTLVDRSRFCYTPEYSETVAGTVIEVDQAEWRTVEVSCTGPFALWIGGQLVAGENTVSYMEPLLHSYRWRFTAGCTELVIASWQVAFREVRQVLGVRIDGLPVRVVIPSAGADEYATAVAEQVLDSVAISPWAVGDGIARITGPAGAALVVAVDDAVTGPVRLDADGRGEIVLAAIGSDQDTEPNASGGDVTASMLTTGERRLTVGLDDPSCPVRREFAVGVLPEHHRTAPTGDPAQWRIELLQHVAAGEAGTARALARDALDSHQMFELADLDQPLSMIDSRCDCADFEAVGLLNLWHRIPSARWPAGARERVRSSLLAFKYWIDQPGLDAMCYFTENHQFVWHTAETLAGEAFPDDIFGNAAWTGREHARHGQELARQWITRKSRGGFSEFDSNAYLAIDSLALTSLLEHAADPDLRRSAEALLDKILLTLAGNSWRGIHGSAHGRSYTPTLRSSRFEETAPIMWSLWGTGSLNSAVLPATVLATSQRYRLPPVIAAAATALPESWSGRQVYRGRYRRHHDLLDRPYGSDVQIWRTPDGMLSSVQDYRVGLPGLQEHIWGATLGAEIQVFATYPATDSISPSARPNAWAGQRILPRVRQFGDTVIALHARPADDPAAATHLWFPAPLMDTVAHRGSWLAGQVGDGYVAVAAAGGLTRVSTGDEADQAFRPIGDGRAYLCTVGRTAVDGSFEEFLAALVEPDFGDGGEPVVRWTARDGRTLSMTWSGTPIVDGRPIDLSADGTVARPPHLDNPACHSEFGDATLSAEWSGHRLLLDLQNGRRLVPDSGVSECGTSDVKTRGDGTHDDGR